MSELWSHRSCTRRPGSPRRRPYTKSCQRGRGSNPRAPSLLHLRSSGIVLVQLALQPAECRSESALFLHIGVLEFGLPLMPLFLAVLLFLENLLDLGLCTAQLKLLPLLIGAESSHKRSPDLGRKPKSFALRTLFLAKVFTGPLPPVPRRTAWMLGRCRAACGRAQYGHWGREQSLAAGGCSRALRQRQC